MQPLSVPDAKTLRETLNEELHHSAHARYLNRLYCLLLVAGGHTCYEAAKHFATSPRAVELWIHRYAEAGIDGLKGTPSTGRGSRKLTKPQLNALEAEIYIDPHELGYESHTWNGKLLEAHVERKYGVKFSIRQCQRLLHQLRCHQET